MATLKEAIEYASKNPNSDFAKQLTVFVQSGRADKEANETGINLTPIKRVKIQAQEPSIISEETKKGGVLSSIGNFAYGAGKGLVETAQNIGNLVAKPVGKLFGIEEEKIGIPQQYLEADGTAQELGKGVERIAEFFVPAGKIAKIENTVNSVIGASKVLSPVAKSVAKTLATGSIEALFGGAVTTAQTGDIEQGKSAGLISGVLGGGGKAVGETLRAINLPEKLYSRIFKNNFNSVKSELKTDVINNIKKTQPERYASLLKSGVVKEVAGQPIVNETLAKQALDRGLKGSLKNMATSVIDDTFTLESQAQNIVKGKNVLFKSNEGAKNLKALFTDIASDYKNVGDGTIFKKANEYAKLVTSGKLKGEKALEMRRFLDGMRNKASYMPSQKLSLSQSNLKYWSDIVRNKLGQIKGLGDIMKEYKFNIEALDSLAKESARRDNKEVLGLIDSIFFGAGLSGGEPATGATINVIRKALSSPTGLTETAQKLQKGTSTGLGVVTRGEIGKQLTD